LKFDLFQGGKICSKLVAELKGVEDIVIEEGSAGARGKVAAQDGMRKSIFCLSPAGDTPSSARLFDAIVSGCIPVVVSDELELPFEGILDYRKVNLTILPAFDVLCLYCMPQAFYVTQVVRFFMLSIMKISFGAQETRHFILVASP
jgi:hypothetical protein